MQLVHSQRRKSSVAHHHIAIAQNVLHLAPICAAVHANKAADGSGNGAQKLKTSDFIVTRSGRHQNARCASAAFHRDSVGTSDFSKGLTQADNDTPDTTITDDQVRSQAKRYNRRDLVKFA